MSAEATASLAEAIASIGEPLGLDPSKAGMLAKLWQDEFISLPVENIGELIRHRLGTPDYAIFVAKPEPAAPEPGPLTDEESRRLAHDEWTAKYRENQAAALRGDLIPRAPQQAPPTPEPLPSRAEFASKFVAQRDAQRARKPWEVRP